MWHELSFCKIAKLNILRWKVRKYFNGVQENEFLDNNHEKTRGPR